MQTLRALRDRLDADDFLTAIEELTMRERYYTPEQLEQLEQRRQELGEEAIREVEREWAEIFATLRAEMDAGHRPRRPEAAPDRRARAASSLAMFTGGDPGIKASLKQMWETEGPEKVVPRDGRRRGVRLLRPGAGGRCSRSRRRRTRSSRGARGGS